MKMPERRSLQGGKLEKNWVAKAWEPMSDRRNGLGWGKGTKAKNFVKDVMETRSCEYGFILKWINHIYYAYKEVVSLKIVCIRVDCAVDNQL